MSSESGESQSSAHNGSERDIDTGPEADQTTEQEDRQDEEVQELHSSSSSSANVLTFSRTRSIPQHHDEESPSQVPVVPRIERPESLLSVSIPDDTPSIQVAR